MLDKTNTTANRRSAGYARDLSSIFSRLEVPGDALISTERNEMKSDVR